MFYCFTPPTPTATPVYSELGRFSKYAVAAEEATARGVAKSDDSYPKVFVSISVIIQGHKASDIHSHPATLSTVKMDLYQVLVGRSTTPFASSRARCGESLSR